MRKQEDTTSVVSNNTNNNLYRSKPSFIDKLIISFRDFIENAE
ncbi:hypothetical protein [Polaribacter sp. SA4-12]|nr:hypothetical protein [Polaribacter sp. SA4-12]